MPGIISEKELVENNIGLVHSCANRFRGRGIEYDDLFQAGCVGLVKAASGFEPERGFQFSTYAVPAILGEIRRMFRDGGAVKVGRAVKERARALMRTSEEMTALLGREPTVSELAEKAGISREDAAELIFAIMPPLSLTVESDDDGACVLDIPTQAPEEHITDSLALSQVIATLDGRDREIIKYRYFLGQTQQVTAEKLGMTQVSVSRREKTILCILRRRLIQ